MEIITEFFRKYGLRSLIVIIIMFGISWGITHLLAAPGGKVSVLFGTFEYSKNSGELEKFTKQLHAKTEETEELKKLLGETKNQLTELSSWKERIVKYEKENKELQEQNQKQKRIIDEMKVKETQDGHRKQNQEEIKQLQKERASEKALLDENLNKIQALNNTMAIYEAKCVPVDKIITHSSFGEPTQYTVIKEQDKDSCAKASAQQKERQLLIDKNAIIQKDIESLDKQIYTLRQK